MCSVLFVDLVGFTPLSESRDAEEVRELLSTYFEQARTVVARYGGVVEKFIGDAVMAVWGAPVATEGAAERAVRAALELVDAVAQLGLEVGIPSLRARAGVVTGEVAVTLAAVGEGMVAGDAVNTAARIQSAAPAGAVLVDEATRRLAAAAIGFVDGGQHTLKGKAEPLVAYRATRVLSIVGGAQRVDGLEAPMVGRDAELRLVKELFHATAERSSARLVVVSGVAGVGKTRLGWEFEKYIDGLVNVVWWHRGRCLSYGDGITFWALAEMVRQRFGIAEEDPLETAAAKLAESLPAFMPDVAEQDLVKPRLQRLLGIPSGTPETAPMSREELFVGWQLFFERLAQNQPVLLLIEDGHHADSGLLDFLEQLADQSRRAIYIVLFARPDLVERRPEIGIGRNRTVLNLDSLDERSMDAMLEALVPGMPAEAVAAIASHAQGNPLFAIETIRSLVDRDIVVPRDGQYRLVGDVGSLHVPDSLHGLLAARLDSLSPELRAFVADAAVLGSSFPAEALVAVSGRSAADVTEALAELVRRDILAISADPLSPQRGSYMFTQNMLRQVAYDTLSRRDRKARHLAVATHLRTVFDGDEIMEVVARHYRDALEAVDDDADNVAIGAKAVAAFVRAAERAMTAGAPARAADNFAEAADLTLRVDAAAHRAAADLWVRAAQAGRVFSDFDGMRSMADRAAKSYAEVGDARGEARAQIQAGVALSFTGRITEARDLLTPATDVLRSNPDADTVTALRELAVLELWDGKAIGVELSEEALVLGQELDVPEAVLADLFQVRASAYTFSNQSSRAIAMYDYAIRCAERAGDNNGLTRTLTNSAEALIGRDPRTAVLSSVRAYELAVQMGNRAAAVAALANVAMGRALVGEWAAARETVDRAIERDPAQDETVAVSAILAALRGDLEVARANATLSTLRASEDGQELAMSRLVDAFIASNERRPGEALQAAHDAMQLISELGLGAPTTLWAWSIGARAGFDAHDEDAVRDLVAMLDGHPVGHLPPVLRAERALARARLAAARGDCDAEAQYADAIAQHRVLGTKYHLAHALLDLAAFRLANGTESDELVTEAEAIAAVLPCPQLADRVAALGTVHAQ